MGVKTKSNYKPSGRDLFQTPRYATELLIPFLPHPNDSLMIWECAAGKRAISNVLIEAGYSVFSSDITDDYSIDFLNDCVPFSDGYLDKNKHVIIVTNPPFSRKRQFYERCIGLGLSFALLIPADYCGWMIYAVQKDFCTKIIPTRRIDYITPSGKDAYGGHTADFHSLWLVRGFLVDERSEIYVNLSLEDKKRIY